MKFATFVLAGLAAAVAAVTAIAMQDMPKPPALTNEHKWLQQLKGDWEYDSEMMMGPGQSTKGKGTEHIDNIGDMWIVSKNTGTGMGQTYTGLLTVGYDAEKKRFLGTWVDSHSSYLWRYDGALDAAGKVLTLESEGPGMTGKMCKWRDSTELKSKDERVFTSKMQDEKGEWVTVLTMHAKRKM